MPSRPASQLADDGEAVGTPVPPAYDPSSAEPLATRDGARKSVGPPLTGRNPNGQFLLYSCTIGCDRGTVSGHGESFCAGAGGRIAGGCALEHVGCVGHAPLVLRVAQVPEQKLLRMVFRCV